LQSGVKKLLPWLGLEPTTLDLGSQTELSAMVTPLTIGNLGSEFGVINADSKIQKPGFQ